MNANTKGVFIVIDGPDGAGKSTVIQGVHAALEAQGRTVLLTREPGGAPFAEKIRDLILFSEKAAEADPKTMLLLFMASRWEHLTKTVLPALARGEVVLCDRFDSTTYAYQVVADEQPELVALFHMLRKEYDALVSPHYIVLDVSPETGHARLGGRADKLNHFDMRELVWHQRAREGFHDFLLEVCSKDTYSIVDAEQPPDRVLADTLAAVRAVLAQT